LAVTLKMPVSGAPLLRLIRNSQTIDLEKSEVIDVDDWARRRGRVYGTILVDLERHPEFGPFVTPNSQETISTDFDTDLERQNWQS
jgi:hypothetical protein